MAKALLGAYDTLSSFTAEYCQIFFVRKGEKICWCSRTGRKVREVESLADDFGEQVVLNGVALCDIYVVADVANASEVWVQPYREVEGIALCTPMVRQCVKAESFNLDTNWRILTKGTPLVKNARTKEFYAPGGFYPLVPDGYALIEQFRMSGTSYLLVPLADIRWEALA